MSPDRPPSSSECGTVIETINGDMIQQELIIEHQPHIIDANRPNIFYASTDSINQSASTIIGSTATMAATTTATVQVIPPAIGSKLVIVQQAPGTNYLKETTDGKVVLVATEQMLLNYSSDKHNLNGSIQHQATSNGNNDEELTSLTWLHDSNLLRTVDGSKRHLQAGTISPTSDFLEDSCISEDNGSSVNSNSDQGISIYCTETTTPTKVYHYSSHPNNNNNITNKNLNHKSDIIKHPSIIHLSLTPDKSNDIVRTITTTSSIASTGVTTATINGSMPIKTEYVLDCTSNGANNKNGIDTNAQSTSTPHQHFHKKYLREEHNKVMQQLNAETTVTCTTTNSQKKRRGEQIYEDMIKWAPEWAEVAEGHFVLMMKKNNNQMSPVDYEMESTTISANQTDAKPQVTFITQSTESSPTKIAIPNSPTMQNKPKHPQNLPYDPFVHTNNKPPLSFSSLIFLAIEDAKEKALPVKEIYSWIIQHYPYFKTAPTGWKNSVRHNLSLNKCFQKVEKAPNMGKGSLWRVEQQYKQNLIQALTRSAYHPGTAADDKFTSPVKQASRPTETYGSLKTHARPLDAELFPRLSKYMADMSNGGISDRTNSIVPNVHDDGAPNGSDSADVINSKDNYLTSHHVERIARYWGVDSIDDVNAATAMLALKHGPKVFSENFQTGTPIITSVPSEDHTYSAGGGGNRTNGNNNINTVNNISSVEIINTSVNNTSDNTSNGTSSDAAYESSEESQPHVVEMDLEARRHQEGVDAFLSFATEVSSMSSPIKRPLSADCIGASAGTNHNSTNGYSQYYYYYDDSSPSSTISSASSVQQQPFTVQNQQTYLSSPSPPKKSRSRNLRTKLKKKAWFH